MLSPLPKSGKEPESHGSPGQEGQYQTTLL